MAWPLFGRMAYAIPCICVGKKKIEEHAGIHVSPLRFMQKLLEAELSQTPPSFCWFDTKIQPGYSVPLVWVYAKIQPPN